MSSNEPDWCQCDCRSCEGAGPHARGENAIHATPIPVDWRARALAAEDELHRKRADKNRILRAATKRADAAEARLASVRVLAEVWVNHAGSNPVGYQAVAAQCGRYVITALSGSGRTTETPAVRVLEAHTLGYCDDPPTCWYEPHTRGERT